MGVGVIINIMRKLIAIVSVFILLFGWSCKNDHSTSHTNPPKVVIKQIVIPDFNADSAYVFVKAQVNFGPRIPNSEAHAKCAAWLTKKFKSYDAKVFIQNFKARAYNGKILSGKNIIASFQPNNKQRIMISSHWDSRPFADHDPDPKNHYIPIDGANDGASGVGIIMELARLFQLQHPNIGVDLVLWDLEDYGKHNDEIATTEEDSWALGSKYWSENTHIPGYQAKYGILLDMVGADNPTFTKEHYSLQYARSIVDKVWNTASKLGYQNIFLNEEAGAVMDDHFYVNKFANIPTIDIIHYNSANKSGFFPYWHTLGDNMDIISKSTLGIVGHTLVYVIYHE